MKKGKRGFTVTELVVVLAAVVILAAILIPTMIILINKNKNKPTADQQTVIGMNEALEKKDGAGRPADFENASAVLQAAGYHIPLEPSGSGFQFYWIAEDNRVALVEMKREEPESPDEIVYPEALADKYSSALPKEWSCLKRVEELCTHDEVNYVAIAVGSGGSEYHWVTCAKCHIVIKKDEPHEFEDGVCKKCGFRAETQTECPHAYRYFSNEDGTHAKRCELCGEIEQEDCLFTAEGKCAYCGFAKPAPEAHKHNFKYTSNGDGTHDRSCPDCEEDGADVDNIACLFDDEGKCVYCGYRKP